MCSVYKSWKIGNKSIRITGEKYSHSCPINDFLLIIDVILEIYNVDNLYFTYYDLSNYLIQNKIYDSSRFKRNKYKITVTINTLLLKELITKKSKKGPYQITNIKDIYKFKNQIEKQASI